MISFIEIHALSTEILHHVN